METRKNEVRYSTLEPEKLLNKYIAKRVLKTWIEDFVDEDTGQVQSIERNEVLYDRGTKIDQDTLARIRFDIEAGDIKDPIEVSNQPRAAFEIKNECLYPYIAQVRIKDKKKKFLFYATNVDSAIEILKDYIELNYTDGFFITMVKEYDSCMILIDNLKEKKTSPEELYLNDEITLEEFADTVNQELDENEKPDERKFYQIDAKVMTGESEITWPFIIKTINTDRAMALISHYVKTKQEEREKEGEEHVEVVVMPEQIKLISINSFIPKEFSEAYI